MDNSPNCSPFPPKDDFGVQAFIQCWIQCKCSLWIHFFLSWMLLSNQFTHAQCRLVLAMVFHHNVSPLPVWLSWRSVGPTRSLTYGSGVTSWPKKRRSTDGLHIPPISQVVCDIRPHISWSLMQTNSYCCFAQGNHLRFPSWIKNSHS